MFLVLKASTSLYLPRLQYIYYYRPKRSFGQGNIFTSVCQEFCPQGGGVPDQAPPWIRQVHPPRPGRYTPRTRHPPGPGRYTPRDQTGTPSGPDTPPGPGRYTPLGPDTPPDQAGTTPPGPDIPPGNSRLRNTVNVRPVRILLECILVDICSGLIYWRLSMYRQKIDDNFVSMWYKKNNSINMFKPNEPENLNTGLVYFIFRVIEK